VEVLRVLLDQVLKHEPVESPVAVVERLGVGKTTGETFVPLACEVIAENPAAVQDYKNGKKGALNFLVGQLMKKTRGRADPRELGAMIESLIAETQGG
jgi:aspartyl/glutamyl-tRNA(Asn/Gln) amidotransferase subunit B (EC 6.3.5.-)